jgi:hypothetical protein
MDIAALIAWGVTAGGGFFLLGTWLARGGHRRGDGADSRFPPGLIFGHFLLAAVGLVVWIAFVATGTKALAWTAFGLLVPVALLGFTMFFRRLPTVRTGSSAGRRIGGPTMRGPGAQAASSRPAEAHFPLPVVILHGLVAATTLVLVLLAALTVGD